MTKVLSIGIIFFVCSFFSISSLFAQNPGTVTQPNEWFVVNGSANFGKRFGVVYDANFRFVGSFRSMQHLLRGGLEFQVVKGLSVVPFGYAYIWNYQYGEQPAAFANNEYRFWHQVQYRHAVGKWSLGHRLRLEERYIQKHHLGTPNNELIDDGFINHQGRLRYRAYLTIPLNKADTKPNYIFLLVWDEVHFGWGSAVKSSQPNQNRLFLGAGYQFSKSTSVQGGFFYQFLKKDNGTQEENNIGGMVQLNFGLDFSKAHGTGKQ